MKSVKPALPEKVRPLAGVQTVSSSKPLARACPALISARVTEGGGGVSEAPFHLHLRAAGLDCEHRQVGALRLGSARTPESKECGRVGLESCA